MLLPAFCAPETDKPWVKQQLETMEEIAKGRNPAIQLRKDT
jgi:hypothetical protein